MKIKIIIKIIKNEMADFLSFNILITATGNSAGFRLIHTILRQTKIQEQISIFMEAAKTRLQLF